jgi:hypothetical protein
VSTQLGALYHWSPRSRLSGIKRQGLVPGKRNVVEPAKMAKIPTQTWAGELEDPETGRPITLEEAIAAFRMDSICFAVSPMYAWELSHGTWGTLGTFDLWEVWLEDTDEVRILPNFGRIITEVRVYNRIPKRRLLHVGERTVTNSRRKNAHP